MSEEYFCRNPRLRTFAAENLCRDPRHRTSAKLMDAATQDFFVATLPIVTTALSISAAAQGICAAMILKDVVVTVLADAMMKLAAATRDFAEAPMSFDVATMKMAAAIISVVAAQCFFVPRK